MSPYVFVTKNSLILYLQSCLSVADDFCYLELLGPVASVLVQLTTGTWSDIVLGERNNLKDPAAASSYLSDVSYFLI